jgi:hypothetical protein
MWLSMAASILLIVGATSVVWMQTRPAASLEQYVQSHYGHDGEGLLALANARVPEGDVQAVLAGLGMQAGPAMLERVRYIKFCPTLHGKGAHMVLASNAGLVTVIYMPETTVTQPVLLEWDGIRAEVIALSSGSAAIIGAPGDSGTELRALLKTGIQGQSLDT